MADLVELDVVDSDVILDMYWLHASYTSIDYRTRIFEFQIPNEPIIEWSSRSEVPKDHFIPYLKSRKLVSKRCIYHLVRLKDSIAEVPFLHSVFIMKLMIY